MRRTNHVAALIGNGLSIAYNPGLSCPRLTAELLDIFRQARGDDDVARALRDLSEQMAPRGRAANFEELLGPVEAVAGAVSALESLATATEGSLTAAGNEVRTAIRSSAGFAQGFYRAGVSRVLQLVDQRSHGQGNSVAADFIQALAKAAGDGCCIATLNYDNLLISGVLNAFSAPMDLADGREEQLLEIRPGHRCRGWRLRESAAIDARGCMVLSLHGSLGWLRRREEYVKFRMESLRDYHPGFWADAIAGNTEWQPVVVLTNQENKNRRVAEYPFNLAYEMFSSRLAESSRWLIGGYGFGDECVNAVLREVSAQAGRRVRCLVVTLGDQPEPSIINATLDGADVTVYRQGFGDRLLASQEWTDWAQPVPTRATSGHSARSTGNAGRTERMRVDTQTVRGYATSEATGVADGRTHV